MLDPHVKGKEKGSSGARMPKWGGEEGKLGGGESGATSYHLQDKQTDSERQLVCGTPLDRRIFKTVNTVC